jgi:hypothetical protein
MFGERVFTTPIQTNHAPPPPPPKKKKKKNNLTLNPREVNANVVQHEHGWLHDYSKFTVQLIAVAVRYWLIMVLQHLQLMTALSGIYSL